MCNVWNCRSGCVLYMDTTRNAINFTVLHVCRYVYSNEWKWTRPTQQTYSAQRHTHRHDDRQLLEYVCIAERSKMKTSTTTWSAFIWRSRCGGWMCWTRALSLYWRSKTKYCKQSAMPSTVSRISYYTSISTDTKSWIELDSLNGSWWTQKYLNFPN